MDYGYMQQIKTRIINAKSGSVFTASDFSDIADNATIRQCLRRITEEGVLRRLFNGVYEKPEYSPLLQEYIVADPDAVAQALARNYQWDIAPSGNTALNLLGLSTQVPAKWSYVSDGPYKKYEWDTGAIEFKHRTNKEVGGFSYMTNLVVQALKALGRSNTTKEVKETLSERLSLSDKAKCLEEASKTTAWIYETIKEICGEKSA